MYRPGGTLGLLVSAIVAALVLAAGTHYFPAEAQTTGAVTLFDSGTLTASANGNRVTITEPRGVLLNLNVTAASGTTPTLDVKVQWQDPVTSVWSDLSGAAFQRITAAGSRTLTIYPSSEGPGLLRSITGTDPAANTEIAETVPANTRWRVRSLFATLVTDATAATRNVSLILDDGAATYYQMRATTTQAASLTFQYAASDAGLAGGTANAPVTIPIPNAPVLSGGHRIRTSTIALQATDNWGAPQYQVEEWQGNYATAALPRYIRAVATIGGTTPSFTFSVAGAALK